MRRLIVAEPVARAAIWSRRLAIFALAIAMVAIALSRMRAADPAGGSLRLRRRPRHRRLGGDARRKRRCRHLARRPSRRGSGPVWLRPRRGADRLSWLSSQSKRSSLPPINEVSTDLASPPGFLISTKARAARVGAEPPPSSEETRAAQRGRLSRHRDDQGRDRFDRGLSGRAQRRERPRLAHRRRRAAQPRRRRRGADRGCPTARCSSDSSATSRSASDRAPPTPRSTSARSRVSEGMISAPTHGTFGDSSRPCRRRRAGAEATGQGSHSFFFR